MHWRLQFAGAKTQLHLPALGGSSLKIRKDRTSGKGKAEFRLSNSLPSERFNHRENDDYGHQDRWYFIDNTVESLRIPVAIKGKVAHPSRAPAVQGGQRKHQCEFGL
jgi:hypothetical protein